MKYFRLSLLLLCIALIANTCVNHRESRFLQAGFGSFSGQHPAPRPDTPYVLLADTVNYLPRPRPDADPAAFASLSLLVFKKERILEVWGDSAGLQQVLLRTLPYEANPETPLGVFDIAGADARDGILLNYPNAFYQRKAKADWRSDKTKIYIQSQPTTSHAITVSSGDLAYLRGAIAKTGRAQVLVFPNDGRREGVLDPCFRCPHWTDELLGMLETYLDEYRRPVVVYPVKKQPRQAPQS